LWLPIDCKFPREDYERLLAAQDAADPVLVETASRALEQCVRLEARRIQQKYIAPPATTDFALLYLPTEGLFAELVRRGGLVAELQQSQRIILVGPTTLAALLNSLQMGFRTLAIQQRSSEVWRVLGEAKAEFEKYGQVWDKLAKQLASAQNTAEEAGKRTRAVARKLKDVEVNEIPVGAALPLLALDDDTEAA
jgi:DNA recombination protein RmuC